MRRLLSFAVVAASVLLASSASAQASRTWLSGGAGDDVNPCSRTAPCKTFPGAQSKTATNGTINVIDPGAFGAIHIVKGLTLEASYNFAGVLQSGAGQTAIIVNAPGATVTLRNLDIWGNTVAAHGVRILAASTVIIENCKIRGFTTTGISDERTTNGLLSVRETTISDSYPGGAGTSYGIRVMPAAGMMPTLTVSDSEISGYTNGINLYGSAKASVVRTVFHSNARAVTLINTSEATLDQATLHANSIGIRIVSGATIRLSETTITAGTYAILADNGAILRSFGNNRIDGNSMENGAGLTNIGQK